MEAVGPSKRECICKSIYIHKIRSAEVYLRNVHIEYLLLSLEGEKFQ